MITRNLEEILKGERKEYLNMSEDCNFLVLMFCSSYLELIAYLMDLTVFRAFYGNGVFKTLHEILALPPAK